MVAAVTDLLSGEKRSREGSRDGSWEGAGEG